MTPEPAGDHGRLARRLGPGDAVVVGLASMIGAGVFAALGPAAAAAGAGLLIGLVLAGAVAFANATSSAQLAAVHPESGGTYVYGRRQLGPFWGYLAGWGFVVGKTASCAAMALTFGSYALPDLARPAGVAAVLALTALSYRGIAKTIAVTRVLLAVVLAALGLVVAAALLGGRAEPANIGDLGAGGVGGVLEAAGLLFFAFAGYARIATLGEEVVDPGRTIPRAIPLALVITLGIYGVVALAALLAAGSDRLAGAEAPLAAAIGTGSWSGLTPAVRLGATVASLGVLLSLLLGVSRTGLAMARRRELPGWLDAVHCRYGVPHRAGLAVGLAVAVVVAVADVRGAIGFSSFTVLTYYAIANASVLTLPAEQRRWPRALAASGLVGCGVLALSLPWGSVLGGTGALAAGALVWAVRDR